MSSPFTTQTAVKALVWADDPTGPGTTFDDLLDQLCIDVTDEIEKRIGRAIDEATYTEYYDGTACYTLTLRQGPLVSITSVNEVCYEDAGDGSRTETLTEIEEYRRIEGGLRTEGHLGLAWIERLDAPWSAGRKNYKVIYKAGFATIPATLAAIAARHVALRFRLREMDGIASKETGSGSLSSIPAANIDAALTRALAPFTI